MIALGTRRLAEAVFTSGARDAFKFRGFNMDRISKAAECPSFAAMLTGREVAGLTYGLRIEAEEAAIIAYGDDRTFTRQPRPTADTLTRLLHMPERWWTSPAVSVAGLMEEDTSPAELSMLLGSEDSLSDTLPVSGEARLCALSGQKISELWGIGGASPIHDELWIQALDDAHRRLATVYVPSILPAEDQDLYHVTHIPKMSVPMAIESFGGGVGIVASIGHGRLAQVFVKERKGGELILSVTGLNADLREARWTEGLDGVRAVGVSLEALAEDFKKKNPSWAAIWKACALRMPSGLLARDREQIRVA